MKKLLLILTVPVLAAIIFFWIEVSRYGYEAYSKLPMKRPSYDR